MDWLGRRETFKNLAFTKDTHKDSDSRGCWGTSQTKLSVQIRGTSETHTHTRTTSGYFLLTGPGVAGTALLAALVNFDTTRVSARFSDFSFSFSDFNFCSCCKGLNYLGH